MQEFWIDHGYAVLFFEGVLFVIAMAVARYYNVCMEQVSKMVDDIKKMGVVSNDTLLFGKPGSVRGTGAFGIAYLFYKLPAESEYAELYGNRDFQRQLRKIKRYRMFYTIIFSVVALTLVFILLMVKLYGSDLKN